MYSTYFRTPVLGNDGVTANELIKAIGDPELDRMIAVASMTGEELVKDAEAEYAKLTPEQKAMLDTMSKAAQEKTLKLIREMQEEEERSKKKPKKAP